jgi:hypothetical protein
MFWNLYRCTGQPVLLSLIAGKAAHLVETEPKVPLPLRQQ